MNENKRVFAYFDGSNFYHLLKASFNETRADFVELNDACEENEMRAKNVENYFSLFSIFEIFSICFFSVGRFIVIISQTISKSTPK